MFTIVAPHIWVLTDAVNSVRREALLSTPYETIVAEIASTGIPGKSTVEPNRDPISDRPARSLKRYRIEIRLPPNIVDLFHNGAGGYRAQFYESLDRRGSQ